MFRKSIENIIDKCIRNSEKGPFKRKLVSIFRTLVQQPAMLPFVISYVSSTLKIISPASSSPEKIRLLVLSEERYQQDLAVLGAHPEVELVSLPSKVQELVNAIWVSEIRSITEKDKNAFLWNEHPAVQQTRQNLHNYLKRLIRGLAKRSEFDAIVSCTFYYLRDRDWELAAGAVGIPFFVLHKENMKDPVTHPSTIARYKKKRFKFTGQRIFLANNLERKVLLQAKAAQEEQISIVGGLRMDAIHQRIHCSGIPRPRRKVVLFSSHHCIGLLQIPKAVGYFNPDRDAGFIQYFDKVHGTIAQLAFDNPDVEVVIKPKWMGSWYEEILKAIKRTTGLEGDKIPNLKIGIEVPAQQLIEESSVVVGLNSTTLLEAKLYGRPVIIPLFEEAAGKYFNSNVYFHDYLDEFNIAHSTEALTKSILDELNGISSPPQPLSAGMLSDYLGYFDGQITARVVDLMKQDLKTINAEKNVKRKG
ncbi:MAG: hypothetical protein COB67_04170 [SAR324 cluster bacterium]|uniref:Lipid-A-disaccharide synthase n=1 Tax=SAR324 cluster bacterium TaxID=2024889 RepID=A0A2A4T887_9DELT|nr:MAG: hypothetical protein COB67_04170 [SAR324 cluster bacterium]